MDETTPQVPETQQIVPAQPIQAPQPPQAAAPAPTRDKSLEMLIPINRSGWSIGAGYAALFNIPFVFMAPVGLILGIIGLQDIKKNPSRAGRGRCWFAIIYSGLTILAITFILVSAAIKE